MCPLSDLLLSPVRTQKYLTAFFASRSVPLERSEHAAYLRIEAARVSRKFPTVLGLLADGSVHLTAVSMLVPHLTVDNHAALLASAKHKSKREVEQLVAALRPQPSVPSTIRKLPSQTAPLPAAKTPNPHLAQHQTTQARALDCLPIPTPAFQPQRIAEVKPLAPERYKVQFTASQETYDKLRLAQDLLRHTIPSGDVGAIIDRALTLLVQELQRSRHAAVSRPRAARASATRSSSRYIPAAVKREVWRRDGGQCGFVGTVGQCTERTFLEYHHRVPFADGGAATVENLELRCRGHNGYEAERWFGSGSVREGAQSFIACGSWSGDPSPETEPRGDPQRLFFTNRCLHSAPDAQLRLEAVRTPACVRTDAGGGGISVARIFASTAAVRPSETAMGLASTAASNGSSSAGRSGPRWGESSTRHLSRQAAAR